jgi:molybdenum cofactor sulfurtransferase
LITVYGPADTWMRGGTVTINFHDPAGQPIDYRLIEQQAGAIGISLRTGCFCNPGASEQAHGLTAAELAPCFRAPEPMTVAQFLRALDGKNPGAVRVSLGLASNFADVYAFVQFACGYLDRASGDLPKVSSDDGAFGH